jgi:hypothetical protein
MMLFTVTIKDKCLQGQPVASSATHAQVAASLMRLDQNKK